MRASEVGKQIINIILQVSRPVFALVFLLHCLLGFLLHGLALAPLHVQVFQLLLEFFHQIWVLDVDLFGHWFWLEDGSRAVLQESQVRSNDVLNGELDTSLWNMISCFCSFFISPANDFLELNNSFSANS